MANWTSDKHPRDQHGHFGRGTSTAQSPTSASRASSAADDHAVSAALSLLTPGEAPPARQLRIAHPPTLKGSPALATAWTDPATGLVYVSDKTRAYKNALHGKPIELAAALAHENVHLLNGADEGPAYAKEIEVLQRLNAPSSLVQEKVNVRAEVTGRRKQSERYGGWLGADDATIAAAIMVLNERGLLAPDAGMVDVGPLPPGTNGRFYPSTGRIMISNESRGYHAAEDGDFGELCSTLSHEQWHRRFGASEVGANAQSYRVLRELGCDQRLVDARVRMMSAAAAEQEERHEKRMRDNAEYLRRHRERLARRLDLKRERLLRETADFMAESRRLGDRDQL